MCGSLGVVDTFHVVLKNESIIFKGCLIVVWYLSGICEKWIVPDVLTMSYLIWVTEVMAMFKWCISWFFGELFKLVALFIWTLLKENTLGRPCQKEVFRFSINTQQLYVHTYCTYIHKYICACIHLYMHTYTIHYEYV